MDDLIVRTETRIFKLRNELESLKETREMLMRPHYGERYVPTIVIKYDSAVKWVEGMIKINEFVIEYLRTMKKREEIINKYL